MQPVALVAVCAVAAAMHLRRIQAADCDGDGTLDADAIATGIARDCKRNGVPDTCDIQGARVPFITADELYVGDWIFRVAVADLDGSGVPDAVAIGTESWVWKLKVFLGVSGRRFQEPIVRELPRDARGPVVGDFDRDGILDRVAWGEAAYFLKGRGDGTFEEPVATSATVAEHAADVDGDGTLDLLGTLSSEGKIAVCRGAGNGTFDPPILSQGLYSPWGLAVGDFNADGLLDLAFGSATRNAVRVFVGEGNRAFRESGSYALGLSTSDLIAADVTGDEILDLVAAESDARIVEILPGRGDGTFLARQTIAFDRGPGSVAAGDVDRDGIADLIVGFSGSRLAVLKGTGGGGFVPPVFYAAGPWGLVLADVDADGLEDIVSHGDGVISISYQTPDGDFSAAFSVASPYPVSCLATENFNRDNHLDFATASFEVPGVEAFLGTGGGRAVLKTTIFFRQSVQHLAAGDLDKDGDDDLVVAFSSWDNGVVFLRSKGDGSFEDPVVLTPDGGAWAVGIADLNRDGMLDLAMEGTIGGIAEGLVLLGNGDGTFRRLGTTYSGGHDHFVFADFNNDGLPDIAAIGAPFIPPPLHILIQRGGGVFSALASYALPGDGLWGIDAADFDADGNIDLVVASRGTKEIIALRGRGNGMFRQPANFSSAGAGSTDVLARDFDGDGLADVVTADYAEDGAQGGVSFFRGRGDGTFDRALRIRTATFTRALAAADLNGDGLLDLLAGVGATVAVLLGNSRPYSRDSNHDGVPDECDPKTGCRVPGDINEDVRLDISDAVGLLGYLFLGTPVRLPCGEGRSEDPGNLALLDWQGDGRVDLSDAILILNFLYRGWAPHPLAVPGLEMTACVDIPGCKGGGL